MEEGKMNKKIMISEDNIFADLELENSEEMRARSDLLSELVHVIRKSGLPNKDIAAILEISQPKVSALMSGKINDFSTDTLMQYLAKLGSIVEIRVQHVGRLSKSVKRGKVIVKKRSSRRARKRKSSAKSVRRRRAPVKA
jgi:predicted XRE-type DNA-binding protein